MAQNYKTGLIITGDASGGIRAIKATDNELGKLNKGFDRGSRRSKQFSRDVGNTSQGLAVLRRAAAPIAGMIAGMFAANTLQSQIDWGDQLQKTNLRIGASTESLSQYNYVAKLSGVEFGQLTTAWQRQTRRIAEAAAGTGVAVKALDRLNLSAKELNQLAPEDQFERIAAAMQGVEDSSERVLLAQQLWDSEGVKLVQIVNQGTDAIAAMRAEADALGLTISQQTADSMASYNDEVDRLKFAAQGVSQTLLAELIPSLVNAAQATNSFITGLRSGELERTVTIMQVTAGAAGGVAAAYIAVRGSLIAATIAQTAFNAAMRANPMMLIVSTAAAVAGGLWAVSEGMSEVEQQANQTAGEVRGLAQGFEHLAEAQQLSTRAKVIDEMTRWRLEAAELGSEIVKLGRLQRQSGQLTSQGGAMEIISPEQLARGRQAREELAGLMTQIGAGSETLKDMDAILAELNGEGSGSGIPGLGDATETSTAASREAAKANNTLADSYESLLDRITPNRSEARQYAQDLGRLNLALASGRINTVQYMQQMGRLQESFQAAQRDTTDLADASVAAAFTMEGAWDEVRLNGLRRLDDGIANMWQGAIDGSLDAGEAMKRIFTQTLAEMAHMAITRPIMVQFASSMGMGGGGSIPGLGGGAGGFDLSSIGSLGKTVSGWFGGGAAAAGGATAGYTGALGAATSTGYGGALGSAVSGAANPGMFASMGGLSGIAGGLGAGYAGMQLGSQLAPDAKYGDVAGGLGAVGGFMLGGPLGSAIGGAIGASISKGLFGGNWETKDGGLQLGVSGGDITGHQYERQRKSGGLFSGSSYRTKTSDLDSEFEAALSQTYQAQELALRASLDALGQQSSALNSFSAGLEKISTKGKSDAEVEQAVQDWLQGVVNKAAQSVVDPAEYALAGETTIETLNRLATALTGVNPILEQLHGSAFAASLAGGDAAASLIALSGGMEQFALRAEYYYQNFYTETERQEAAMTQAAQAMGAFTARTGEIVTTTDQLRVLVDGIDRNSVAGRELYAAAMQLAPALVEVENGLERVRDRFVDMLNEAESALGSAEQQARSAWKAFSDQSFGMQVELLETLGDSQAALALQRERELQGIDPLLHETQRFIWVMEDEARAKQGATQAAQNYRSEIERVRNELSNTLGNISGWIDQRNATSQTPGLNLEAAGEQFARQLVLAESGDRSALQSITQYADQYLSAGEQMFASGGAFQSIQQDVLDALQDLPDQISAEEYIADEIKQALREQTQGISTDLSAVLRGDNPSNIAGNLAGYFETLAGGIDGVLTPEQLAIVMSGKATDAELAAIMRAVDLNGDGVMSGLESVIIAGMPTDAVLGNVLRNRMNELDKNQLTYAQIRHALSPIATDAEISRLISEVDANGDGIISKQELTNARVGGLASGIAKSLNPAFDMLDTSLDGLIDYSEFSKAFDGMASDAELRRIFGKLDEDGNGTISRLEALKRSGEGTEDNTKSLEQRAYDQLSELNGLVGEMTRTTDQFIGLNSNIASLGDSINALGVAQAEVARIEKARAAAEKAERERIERERLAAQRESLASEIGRLQNERKDLASTGVSSPNRSVIDSSYKHVPNAINNINRIADNILGSSGVTDRSAERLRDYYTKGGGFTQDQGVGDTPGPGGAYSPGGLYWPYVRAYIDEIESAVDTRQSAKGLSAQIAELQARLKELPKVNGSHADGNWNVGFDGYIAELHKDEMVVPARTANMLRDLPGRSLPMPDMPLPQFPALGQNDVLQVLQDVKRELVESRKENKRLQEENNRHAAAAVAVQQTGFSGQISEQKKSNLALDDMSAAARLEASR